MKIHLQKSRIYVIITWLIVKRVDEVGNLRVSAPEKTALAASGLQRVMRLSLRSAIREGLFRLCSGVRRSPLKTLSACSRSRAGI
jgi:hypothetical protein